MSYLEMARRIVAEGCLVEVNTAPASQVAPDPPNGFGRCISCANDLPVGIVIGRCVECQTPERNGSVQRSGVPYPLHVVIDDHPVPAEAVADLVVLRRVVSAYGAVWHEEGRIADATELGERIDELLERLASQGCAVRVEALS